MKQRPRPPATWPGPGRSDWFVGALCWGLAIDATLLVNLALSERIGAEHNGDLLLLYFAGGVLGWLAALPVIHRAAHGRAVEARFAAALLFLTLSTIAALALLFALQYRMFYAQWHAPFATRVWMLQFLFTSASAVYQFGVLGLRLMLPAAVVVFPLAAFILARRLR